MRAIIPLNKDIREERVGEATPSLVSIRGTGLGHPGATAVPVIGPSRDDLVIGIESISG